MKKSNAFFETFAGEYVEIVQDFEITASFQASEDGPREVRMPMTVQGFLMDSDDTFVYLSHNSEEISQALPLSSIKHIQIIPPRDEMEESLDEAPTPEDRSGYN